MRILTIKLNNCIIYYIYGVDGIAGFKYDTTEYLYRKNVQGDVTHIYTEDGEQVGHYIYDAWGNVQILQDKNGIAELNPFRYRSYYYDEETCFYYLQTRYYDPELGRFISADSIEYIDTETLGGLNLYAYCLSNPVMGTDSNGKFVITSSLLAAIGVAALVGSIVGVIGTLAGDLISGTMTGELQFSSWETYLGNAIGGAIGGMLSLIPGMQLAGGVIGSTLGTFLGHAIGKATGSNDMSWKDIGIDTAVSFGISLLTAGLFDALKVPGIKIQGITQGSHSWGQVFKSGLTKTVRYGFRMSCKTLMKEAGYLFISSFTADFLASLLIEGGINKIRHQIKKYKKEREEFWRKIIIWA